jgi:hypothetical protein
MCNQIWEKNCCKRQTAKIVLEENSAKLVAAAPHSTTVTFFLSFFGCCKNAK